MKLNSIYWIALQKLRMVRKSDKSEITSIYVFNIISAYKATFLKVFLHSRFISDIGIMKFLVNIHITVKKIIL